MGAFVSEKGFFEFKEYGKDDARPFRCDKGREPGYIAYGDGLLVEWVEGNCDRFQGIKAVRKTITINNKDTAKREANILRRARHGHVVNFITAYFDNNHYTSETRLSIIMDPADDNLGVYLHRGDGEEKKGPPQKKWFGCLINAVAYIHGLGIRHRDIKPANVLIRGDNVLLADFGISKMALRSTNTTAQPGRSPARTAGYCAPDVEEGGTRGRSADIFSLGAVFLEMLLAHPPPGRDENYRKEADELRHQLRERTGPNNSSSYALNIEAVHDWMGGMEARLQLDGWRSTILSLCREMLDARRNRRPKASDLCSWWPLQPLVITPEDCSCGPHSDGLEQYSLREINEELRTAYGKGHRLMAGLLRRRGAAISDGDALVAASKGRLWDVAESFLENGANLKTKDNDGQTALHIVAREGHTELAEKLLRGGADIWAMDTSKKTALRLAAGKGDIKMVRQLLRSKFPSRKRESECLGREGNDMDEIRDEVKAWLYSSSTDMEATAMYRHEVELGLLDGSSDVEARDDPGQTLLVGAAMYGHGGVLRLLLDRKVDIEKKEYGQAPLVRAATHGHESLLRVLLDREANIEAEDEFGQTPLLRAAMYGHEAIVRLLLDWEVRIKSKDEQGRTPLWEAAAGGHDQIVRPLLQSGANIEAKDGQGQTPLWKAAAGGHDEIVRLLLHSGANIEAKDGQGRTPLWKAAAGGHDEIVRLLLHSGANIEAKDGQGRTPLWKAAAGGHEKIVRLLLENGAKTEARSHPLLTNVWTLWAEA